MDIEKVSAARKDLDEAAAQRFAARHDKREAKLQEVAEHGVLATAGVGSAVRRALQLTVAEGRAAIVDPTAPTDRALEAIIGFNDCDQVNFLEHGLRAARSVCRLLYQGQPIGTGFLVAPGLLLTNHHVIADAEAAAGFVAEFDWELDADENMLVPKRFALDPARLFATSPVDAYDFSLVAVRPTGLKGEDLAQFGWLPLTPDKDKILEGEPVVIIQHPEGREKQLCMFHSEMVDRFEQYIHYTTDTEVGSSGSPAFNRQWQVIGLHHASAPSGQVKRGVQTAANEGIRISAVLESLQSNQQVTGTTAGLFERLTNPVVQDSGRPKAPVEVAPAAQPRAEPLESRTVIRARPPNWYDNPPRTGYCPNFLAEDVEIPLPKLPSALAEDVVKLADGSQEIKYTHYSVVMSASRRLAYFSAANLDGASAKSISRTDRDPDRPEPAKTRGGDLEAADVWWFDGRIPPDAQVGAKVYDQTAFDYGHLTRRLDPVWGDDRTLRIANDDTFHMTNCTPQHHQLNAVTWEHLEEAVYKAATQHGLKLVVITGPVLDPRDPTILDVQCPTAYWKIIAYLEDGALKAMGFLQWQTDLVAEIEKHLESLKELNAAEQWHVPISDIARLTALDFGPLLDADVKAKGRGEPLTESIVAGLFNQTAAPLAAV